MESSEPDSRRTRFRSASRPNAPGAVTVGHQRVHEHGEGGRAGDQLVELRPLQVELVRALPPQRVEQGLLGGVAALIELVMGQHVEPDLGEHRLPQHQDMPLGRHPQLDRALLQRLLHQSTEDLGHPQAALDRGDGGRIDPVAADPDHVGGHRADGAQGDRLLAEGGQHPLDVVHEDPARTDDQHPAGLEAAPVRVEQVRGPVQGDHRLAGAGTTRDHREALVRGANGLVLLGLDGGHDVAHGVPTGPAQRGHQGAFADHHELAVGVLTVQQVVLDADHGHALAAQHATPDHLHRVGRGGPVERLRRPRAPVDHQRLVLLVADADPTDVADLAVRAVEPAEDQALVLGVQHGQPLSRLEREDVALVQAGAVLLANVGATVRRVERAARSGDLLSGSGGFGESGVHQIHVRLLDGQLALDRCRGLRVCQVIRSSPQGK